MNENEGEENKERGRTRGLIRSRGQEAIGKFDDDNGNEDEIEVEVEELP